jgi:signal transduction histidine kinase
MVGIGVVDFVTGAQASVVVFYFLPIALGTWILSRAAGTLLAVGSALAWLVAERIEGVPYSHPFIQAWNAIALLASFMIVVFLLSALSESYMGLEEKVRSRTAELVSEIEVRKKAEERLVQTNATLCRSQQDLHQTVTDLQQAHAALKKTQMQLIQAAKMESLGRLAAGVAHEVKNPLMTLQMGVDYLGHLPNAQEEPVAGVLRDQSSAIQRATAIINELLDFARPTELHAKQEDLNAIIEIAIGLVKYDLAKSRIVVAREMEPNLPILHLDRNKIEQVFVNAFANAAHAMPQGGTLTVRTYVTPGAPAAGAAPAPSAAHAASQDGVIVTAEVDDTGTGIPQKNLAKVFDPFFTTKAPGKGSGLGLSVARQIVEMHHGSVDLANRTEGGVRFTVKFFGKGTG